MKRKDYADYLKKIYTKALNNILSYFDSMPVQEVSTLTWQENAQTKIKLGELLQTINDAFDKAQKSSEKISSHYIQTSFKKGVNEANLSVGDYMKKTKQPEIKLSWSPNVSRVMAEVEKMTKKELSDVNEETQKELKKVLKKSIRLGWSIDRTKHAITDLFERLPDEHAEHKLGVVAKVTRRAEAIARVSTIRAYSHGAEAYYNEIAKLGWGVKKQWISTTYELSRGRTCSVCNALNGKQVGLNENFSTNFKGKKYTTRNPPIHVNCRCTIGSVIGHKR
jgi:SMC interacting uncharacterized protein involved in chromosome segregation